MPTSQTKIGEKKVIPNSRRSSGKKKGGQPGHKRHTLDQPEEKQVTEVVEHGVDADEHCPRCGSDDFSPTGEYNRKYEYDVQVKVVRKKHIFWHYRCRKCGALFRARIDPGLKENAQYGIDIQAMMLAQVNTGNVPFNRTAAFVRGITDGALNPSEGYIVKLQMRAYAALETFENDLRRLLIQEVIVYWDDTVIMVNTHRECLRFYETERIALYCERATV